MKAEHETTKMRSTKEKLSGIFPSITTPFVDGQISHMQLASNIKKYNKLDLGGYMILGGNGEYLGLTPTETRRVVEMITENTLPGRTIVAGVGVGTGDDRIYREHRRLQYRHRQHHHAVLFCKAHE